MSTSPSCLHPISQLYRPVGPTLSWGSGATALRMSLLSTLQQHVLLDDSPPWHRGLGILFWKLDPGVLFLRVTIMNIVCRTFSRHLHVLVHTVWKGILGQVPTCRSTGQLPGTNLTQEKSSFASPQIGQPQRRIQYNCFQTQRFTSGVSQTVPAPESAEA